MSSTARFASPLAALPVFLTVAAAQSVAPQRQPEAQAQQSIAEAQANLKLKPEQQRKVRALLQDGADRMRAIQTKYYGDDTVAALGAKLRELRAVQRDFRGQLSTILTPEQMLHWDLMRDELRQYARERLKPNPLDTP